VHVRPLFPILVLPINPTFLAPFSIPRPQSCELVHGLHRVFLFACGNNRPHPRSELIKTSMTDFILSFHRKFVSLPYMRPSCNWIPMPQVVPSPLPTTWSPLYFVAPHHSFCRSSYLLLCPSSRLCPILSFYLTPPIFRFFDSFFLGDHLSLVRTCSPFLFSRAFLLAP